MNTLHVCDAWGPTWRRAALLSSALLYVPPSPDRHQRLHLLSPLPCQVLARLCGTLQAGAKGGRRFAITYVRCRMYVMPSPARHQRLHLLPPLPCCVIDWLDLVAHCRPAPRAVPRGAMVMHRAATLATSR